MNIKYEHEVLPGNKIKSEVQLVDNVTKHGFGLGMCFQLKPQSSGRQPIIKLN